MFSLPASIRALLNNPAAVVGLVRAASILLVSFGLKGLSGEQLTALDGTIVAIVVVVSLLFSGITVKKTVSVATAKDAVAVAAVTGDPAVDLRHPEDHLF